MPKFNPDKYATNYKKRNYDQIGLLFPKGYREKLRTAATNAGFPSVNAMFNSLAADMIRRYLKPQEPTAPDEFPADPPEPSEEIPEDAEQDATAPTEPQTDTEPED